jgi:hypothetical protein
VSHQTADESEILSGKKVHETLLQTSAHHISEKIQQSKRAIGVHVFNQSTHIPAAMPISYTPAWMAAATSAIA